MPRCFVLLAVVLSLAIASIAHADPASPRQRLLMDPNWRFTNGDPADVGKSLDYPEVKHLDKVWKADLAAMPKLLEEQKKAMNDPHLGEKISYVQAGFDDSKWRALDLPHDWAVELPFSEKANYQHGFKDIDEAKGTDIGWYRKTFTLPAEDKGKTLWLEFDGVYRNSLVWLNGKLLGRHPSGYTSFMYDITKAANFGGKNTLVVRVDASRPEGWFYEGAGIYRHVWLTKTSPVHVAHWGTIVSTTMKGSDALVNAEVELENSGPKNASCIVVTSIVDASGNPVADVVAPISDVPAGNRKKVTYQLTIPKAQLWSPDSPYLYKLVVTVHLDRETILDQCSTSLGVRTIEFNAEKGLLVNGKREAIQGTCNHQDHAGVGSAIPDRLNIWRLEQLKAMGCNAYRCSHNPPTPEVLDACDRMGILVLDENRRMGDDPEALGQLESLIKRDRNHPSVIAWSILNEEFRDNMQGDDTLGAPIAKKMQDLAHQLDPTRLCTAAMNGAYGQGFSNVIDIMGFNYPTRGKRPITSDEFHQKFPTKPTIGTEDGSTRCTRGEYGEDKDGNISAKGALDAKGNLIDAKLKELGYQTGYDVQGTSTAEHWWTYYFDRPFLSGSFAWTGFDYRGEPTPYKWPCTTSHFGIMDLCGIPKDNFYYYQAWWHDPEKMPVVHVFPHWNWAGKEGKTINVWVHSNAEEVELVLNGAVIGKKAVEPRKHVEWDVPYKPGTLVARGYRGGKLVTEDKVETTGAAVVVELKPDRAAINADGEDVSVVTVSVRDDAGRVVPTADNEVTFKLEGPGAIIGVGNGNPSSHEPDKADHRKVFNGYAQVIVQAKKTAGEIKLTATSPGLKATTVTITAKPATPRAAVE